MPIDSINVLQNLLFLSRQSQLQQIDRAHGPTARKAGQKWKTLCCPVICIQFEGRFRNTMEHRAAFAHMDAVNKSLILNMRQLALHHSKVGLLPLSTKNPLRSLMHFPQSLGMSNALLISTLPPRPLSPCPSVCMFAFWKEAATWPLHQCIYERSDYTASTSTDLRSASVNTCNQEMVARLHEKQQAFCWAYRGV